MSDQPQALDRAALVLIAEVDDEVAAALAARLLPHLRGPYAESRLLTTEEAASILGVHRSSLARAAAAGRVPGARRVGRHWRFAADQLALDPPASRNIAAAAPITDRPALSGSSESAARSAMRALQNRQSDR